MMGIMLSTYICGTKRAQSPSPRVPTSEQRLPTAPPTGKIDKTYGGASFADMKGLNRKRYENLPLFLNATAVANALPVSQSSDYELMHEPGFPVLKLCSRMVIPKKQFIRQMHEHTGGGR